MEKNALASPDGPWEINLWSVKFYMAGVPVGNLNYRFERTWKQAYPMDASLPNHLQKLSVYVRTLKGRAWRDVVGQVADIKARFLKISWVRVDMITSLAFEALRQEISLKLEREAKNGQI
jgi:hypothetical protein